MRPAVRVLARGPGTPTTGSSCGLQANLELTLCSIHGRQPPGRIQFLQLPEGRRGVRIGCDEGDQLGVCRVFGIVDDWQEHTRSRESLPYLVASLLEQGRQERMGPKKPPDLLRPSDFVDLLDGLRWPH